mmetsp:Transcript_22491/g.57326  ORF Transcript_22491/g.57326 Transcript_22491/m.57326 type:complete len:679 (-) Transcript_22491:124-2160(-)
MEPGMGAASSGPVGARDQAPASSAAPLAGAGKAHGKGKAAPPPPPPVARASGTGKGGGKYPTYMPEPSGKGHDKGKGKGKVPPAPRSKLQPDVIDPPQHLIAPEGTPKLRITRPLANAKGTLWEGLDPWGSDSGSGGRTLAINFDRLREQWTLRPAPATAVAMPAAPRSTGILPAQVQQQIDIATKALKLTPELVRQGLSEDFSALSADQARVVAEIIAPHAPTISETLRALVQHRGVGALTQAEALLWAVDSIPRGAMRATLLHTHCSLSEDLALAERQAADAEAIVQRLRTSFPLRALLQTILVVRNVLAQQELVGFHFTSLGGRLASERLRRGAPTLINPATGLPSPGGASEAWVRENHPSSLRLACEILLDTQEQHKQLRLERMRAIGKVMRANNARRLIWQFLDDLKEPVLDVFKLLRDCTGTIFESEILRTCIEHKRHLDRLRANIPQVLRDLGTPPPPDHTLAAQLAELGVRITEAIHVFRDCGNRLTSAAHQTCALIGVPANPTAAASCMEGAAQALTELRHLGAQAQQETRFLQEQRASARRVAERRQIWTASRSGARHLPARIWTPVETSHEVLHTTSDPNLIRRLRGEEAPCPASDGQPAKAVLPAAAAAAKAAAKAKCRTKENVVPSYADLRFGGPEGVYRRDPFTGRWGPRLDGVDGVPSIRPAR